MRSQAICLAMAIVLLSPYSSAQWFQQNSGTTVRLYSVALTDANTGTVVGDSGTILYTTNGGVNWFCQESGTTFPLMSVSFADSNNGWIVGGVWPDSGCVILHTINGGMTWLPQTSGTSACLNHLSCVDATTATAVGWGGTILTTTNAGTTWAARTSGTTWELRSVCFTDANTGTAVGMEGTILRTTNGGADWARQSGGTGNLHDVYFTDANTGIVTGYAGFGSLYCGEVLHTTDGGSNWTPTGLMDVNFLQVRFTDANTGTAVGTTCARGSTVVSCYTGGFDGIIERTTDGGASWTGQILPYSVPYLGVCFADSSTGIAVGYCGTILRTINGGVAWAENKPDKIPVGFSLVQNYPNPFNPSTNIRIELPQASQVSLRVYDMLGREVSELVNERRDAGVHEVKFDGSELSSGVYLYRLQAGSFTQTRKLLLVR